MKISRTIRARCGLGMYKQNGRGKLGSTGFHFVLNFVLREPVVSFCFCTCALTVVGLGLGP